MKNCILFWTHGVKEYIGEGFYESNQNDVIANSIVKHFQNKYITENDKKLLKLVFNKSITQEEFNDFLKLWDIEAEGAQKTLMLAYFMFLHPELKYPKYIEPRLKGVISYFRFLNLKYISHFKKVAKKLKESGINVLILKGGAIRHFRDDFPRAMGDIDILVSPKDYENAKKIAFDFGYKYTERKHSIDLYEPDSMIDVLDIHKKLDMLAEYELQYTEDLFKRAQSEKIFGENDIYIPCIEDMLFILLTNLTKNIIFQTGNENLIHTIWDCEYLISSKPDFNWDIIKQNAIKTKTENSIAFATKFIHEFLPDKLPILFEKEFLQTGPLYIYNKFFIQFLREKKSELKSKIYTKNWLSAIITYICFRPQYTFYLRSGINKNLAIAKLVLKNLESIKW